MNKEVVIHKMLHSINYHQPVNASQTSYFIYCYLMFVQIKDKLLKEAKAVSATTSSEFLRKAIREKQMKRNGKKKHVKGRDSD